MAGFANAALKFPVAISSYGAGKLIGALPLGNSDAGRAMRASLYKTGESAQEEFDTNTLLFGAFQFGDKAQSTLIDLANDTLSLKFLRPSYIRNMVSDLVQTSTGALGAVSTATARRLLGEQFGNTFDVIGFVNHVDAPSELSIDQIYPLDAMIEKMYAKGDYPALWLIEGLGERYAHAYMAEGRRIRGLLSTGQGAAVPEKTQLMMHAGAGIAFAKRAIKGLTPCSRAAEIRDALKLFLALCDENSQERYKGAAIESLGLVTRTWHVQMVAPVYGELATLDPIASEYFWHGAGRAMYFSPMYMIPGLSPFRAAEQEPPDDIAKRNARAGVAWAFTAVNLRHPEITAHFLRHRADEIAGNDAFADGVYSTLIMAGEMVPGHRYVNAYCQYQPDTNDPATLDAWNKYVGSDCLPRVTFYRRVLKTHGKLGEIFRYHGLPDFVARLDAGVQQEATD